MVEKIFINAEISVVYQTFWNIFEWDEILPHVSQIKNIESRENYQHVLMDIDNRGRHYTIETIRTGIENRSISFNQVDSDSIISHHSGNWKFSVKGCGTLVECTHCIKIESLRWLSDIMSKFAWNFYIRRNSLMTLQTLKLECEFISDNFSQIYEQSQYIEHKIKLNVSTKDSFEIIANPKLWPKLYGQTAKLVNIRKESDKFIDFELVEMVGKWSLKSRIFMRQDKKKKRIYYQHINPRFPIKYMIIHWEFNELNDFTSEFLIRREFSLKIPRFIYILLETKARKIINHHVIDNQKEKEKLLEKKEIRKYE